MGSRNRNNVQCTSLETLVPEMYTADDLFIPFRLPRLWADAHVHQTPLSLNIHSLDSERKREILLPHLALSDTIMTERFPAPQTSWRGGRRGGGRGGVAPRRDDPSASGVHQHAPFSVAEPVPQGTAAAPPPPVDRFAAFDDARQTRPPRRGRAHPRGEGPARAPPPPAESAPGAPASGAVADHDGGRGGPPLHQRRPPRRDAPATHIDANRPEVAPLATRFPPPAPGDQTSCSLPPPTAAVTSTSAAYPSQPQVVLSAAMESVMDEIEDALAKHHSLVVVGDTGCGKTTRVPLGLYLGEAYRRRNTDAARPTHEVAHRGRPWHHRTIAVTQPRRLAATTVAKYVASLARTPLGRDVGFHIRMEDNTSTGTRLTFMTDGILLQQLVHDPTLSSYDIVCIDEAHERSLNIDFVLGLIKRAQRARLERIASSTQGGGSSSSTTMQPLKVIIMSATIDFRRFALFFDQCPIIELPNRPFPVDVMFDTEGNDLDDVPLGSLAAREVVTKKAVDCLALFLMNTCVPRAPVGADPAAGSSTMPPPPMLDKAGDVLIFMSGEDDIDMTIEAIRKSGLVTTFAIDLHKLHSTVPPDVLERAFEPPPPGRRRVIVSTNIAETSVTIDGIRCVIDSGLIKQTDYDPHAGVESLLVQYHCQSGCDQRAGRAGRTAPGVCFRLYSHTRFADQPRFAKPEIMRCDLAHVVLQMKTAGIHDPFSFPFLDPPSEPQLRSAIKLLKDIGALSVEPADAYVPAARGATGRHHRDDPRTRRGDDDDIDLGTTPTAFLTRNGHRMAALALRPDLANLVLHAVDRGCAEQALIIAALVNASKPVLIRPKEEAARADAAHARFGARANRSDFLTRFEAYCDWGDVVDSRGSDAAYRFAKENYLSHSQLDECRREVMRMASSLRRCGVDAEAYTSWETRQGPSRDGGWRPPADADGGEFYCAPTVSTSTRSTPLELCISSAFQHSYYVKAEGGTHYDSLAPMIDEHGAWLTATRPKVYVHPSCLAHQLKADRLPELVVALDIVTTTKTYARLLHPVNLDDLPTVAMPLVRRMIRVNPESDTKWEYLVNLVHHERGAAMMSNMALRAQVAFF